MNNEVSERGGLMKIIIRVGIKLFFLIGIITLGSFATDAQAREVEYLGSEETIYVTPGEPTQIAFPGNILGGYKRSQSSVTLDRKDNYLIIFARPELSVDGEAIIVHIDDRRSYALRVMPSSDIEPRDQLVTIRDEREPDVETSITQPEPEQPTGFAPSSTVSGLMREMVLVAEFGKQKGIPGFRRSNKYSGETILHDGTVSATIDEIFLGSNLWGYVLSVENKLDTTQKINPATFRLDGTRAISASQWELAPKPITDEQRISNKHVGKIYIVTRAKR